MTVQIDKKFLVLMMESGYVYLGMRKLKEAEDVFKGVAVLAPDSDVPIIAIGNVEFCKGKFENAIKYYSNALKKDKDSLFAKVYTAEALFFLGKTEESKSILEEVKKKDKDGGAGGFAEALLRAINDGFTPKSLAGLEPVEIKNEKKI